MKKSLIFLFSVLMISCFVTGQETIQLTFTGVNNNSWTQLDSVRVINRTQGGDTLLTWPDTTLVLGETVGIGENTIYNSSLKVYQNYPNPVLDKSTVRIFVPKNGAVSLVVTDLLGRQVVNEQVLLDAGYHIFTFKPGNEKIYFITATIGSQRSTIRVTNLSAPENPMCSLSYEGSTSQGNELKSMPSLNGFIFVPGDELLYVGYSAGIESGMLHIPLSDENYTLQFASNIPCPGTPTVDYGGKTYNTIQVMNQCWLKENLDIGTMILNDEEPADNQLIEKYCMENEPDSCDVYGGFYQWGEMMQYTTQNNQGICPDGWHIPSDEEFKIMEGAVDSQYGIGSYEWDNNFYRGLDAGTMLKSSSLWHNDGNGSDAFGVNIIPAGYKGTDGFFYNQYRDAFFWTATESDPGYAWYRYFSYSRDNIMRNDNNETQRGYSVRCIKD